MKSFYGIIYKCTSKTTGMSYVGQTNAGLKARKSQHIIDALENESDTFFHKAIRELGVDDFEWEILEHGLSPAVMNDKEIEYISLYNTKEGGYNSTSGGGNRIAGYNIYHASCKSFPFCDDQSFNHLCKHSKNYNGDD